jgi:hypothetical protein
MSTLSAVTPAYATHKKFFCPAEPRFDNTFHRLSDSGATQRFMAGSDSKLEVVYFSIKPGDDTATISTSTVVLPVQQGSIVLISQDPADGAWVVDVPRNDPRWEIEAYSAGDE